MQNILRKENVLMALTALLLLVVGVSSTNRPVSSGAALASDDSDQPATIERSSWG
jgi:hypothetical protein